mmetsp:Transcript_15326/g.38928  ORF Transcript_15326/g.38928 Transcript_15326/m.38928 type:complete len:477 (-) Transcript_15326:1058-2488(-)
MLLHLRQHGGGDLEEGAVQGELHREHSRVVRNPRIRPAGKQRTDCIGRAELATVVQRTAAILVEGRRQVPIRLLPHHGRDDFDLVARGGHEQRLAGTAALPRCRLGGVHGAAHELHVQRHLANHTINTDEDNDAVVRVQLALIAHHLEVVLHINNEEVAPVFVDVLVDHLHQGIVQTVKVFEADRGLQHAGEGSRVVAVLREHLAAGAGPALRLLDLGLAARHQRERADLTGELRMPRRGRSEKRIDAEKLEAVVLAGPASHPHSAQLANHDVCLREACLCVAEEARERAFLLGVVSIHVRRFVAGGTEVARAVDVKVLEQLVGRSLEVAQPRAEVQKVEELRPGALQDLGLDLSCHCLQPVDQTLEPQRDVVGSFSVLYARLAFCALVGGHAHFVAPVAELLQLLLCGLGPGLHLLHGLLRRLLLCAPQFLKLLLGVVTVLDEGLVLSRELVPTLPFGGSDRGPEEPQPVPQEVP